MYDRRLVEQSSATTPEGVAKGSQLSWESRTTLGSSVTGKSTIRLKPRPVVKKKQISVRVDEDALEKVDELAGRSGYNRSEIINMILRETIFKVTITDEAR